MNLVSEKARATKEGWESAGTQMSDGNTGRGLRPDGGSFRLVLLMAALSACVSAPVEPQARTPQRVQPTTSTYPVKPVANPPKPFQALNVDQRETPPVVAPGTYTVTLTAGGRSFTQPLTVKKDPRAIF